MIYRVQFEGYGEALAEASFPAVAAKEIAEKIGLTVGKVCAVVDESGHVTHWRVEKLEVFYARPFGDFGGGES